MVLSETAEPRASAGSAALAGSATGVERDGALTAGGATGTGAMAGATGGFTATGTVGVTGGRGAATGATEARVMAGSSRTGPASPFNRANNSIRALKSLSPGWPVASTWPSMKRTASTVASSALVISGLMTNTPSRSLLSRFSPTCATASSLP